MMTPFVLAHRSSDSLDVKMTDEFVLQQQQQQQQPCGSHWARECLTMSTANQSRVISRRRRRSSPK